MVDGLGALAVAGRASNTIGEEASLGVVHQWKMLRDSRVDRDVLGSLSTLRTI